MAIYFRPPPSLTARYVTVAALATVIIGCASITTGSHSNESANFDDYYLFSWISNVPFVRGAVISDIPISVLTQRKIEKAVRSESERKGFEFAKRTFRKRFTH